MSVPVTSQCFHFPGRRKLDVQQKFASFGLAEVLCDMYPRLSWDAPAFEGPNPMEHIHGPNCECNPESALRVQYLRLVHNFFDRDFHNNPIKGHVLSRSEKRVLKFRRVISLNGDGSFATTFAELNRSIQMLPSHQTGLLRRIMGTLTNEPVDSMYRFWLSSCLEAFLRGAGRSEQLFVASSGVLEHVIKHVCDHAERKSSGMVSNIQTSFDLLGEIVKYDEDTIALMERYLVRENLFDRFMEVAMENVVDSNVFLRSLFVTMCTISERFHASKHLSCASGGDSMATHRVVSGGPLLRSLPPSCAGRRVKCDTIAIDIAPPFSPALATSTETDRDMPANGTIGSCLSSASGESGMMEVGYLSHTWLEFSPSILSEEAMRIAVEHNKASPLCRAGGAAGDALHGDDGAKGIGERQRLRSSSISFSGIRDAIKNIRRLTSSFLHRDSPPAPTSAAATSTEDEGGSSHATITRDMETVVIESESHIHTSNPDDSSCKNICEKSTGENTALQGDGASSELPIESIRRPVDDGEGTYTRDWDVPAELRMVSTFLLQNEENVVYHLMTSVTVRSITHENVCCVNTALLILLFAHRRYVS